MDMKIGSKGCDNGGDLVFESIPTLSMEFGLLGLLTHFNSMVVLLAFTCMVIAAAAAAADPLPIPISFSLSFHFPELEDKIKRTIPILPFDYIPYGGVIV